MSMMEGAMKGETIYYVLRYNLRTEGTGEYGRWLADHAGGRRGPAGWTYVGTFLDVMGLDQYDYETRWTLNEKGSLAARPLDAETERRIQDRLPFIREGQVGVMRMLPGS